MGKGFPRIFVMLLLLFLLLPGMKGYAAGNLLVNGNFEESENGMPSGWTIEAWVKDEGVTDYGVDREVAYSGEQSAVIHSASDNHARLVQEIQVKPNMTYRFSGYVKTEGLKESASGAHLYIDGSALYYPQFHDTNGEWAYLEFYGKTGAGQKKILFGASLGGYGSVNSGQAWFDDLSVEEVSAAPEGVEVFSLEPTSVGGSAEAEEPVKVSILSTLIYAAIFSLLYAFAHAKLFRDRGWLERPGRRGAALLAVSFAAALALRVYIAAGHGGYENDVALFIFWSDQVVREGIAGFYHSGIFVDYPPGYIYVLFVLGHLKDWFGIVSGSSAELLLYKLPAIAADLGAAAVLYRAARNKLGAPVAIGLALLWLFNPAAILDSAAWGQVDAVFALTLVLAVSGMAEKRFGRASVWYAVAALIKPQAFIFMPVLLIALLVSRKWKDLAVSAYYGFATFILLALPYFWGSGGLKGLYELYKGTLSSYPYATLNAFNVYALNGANWKPLTDKWLFLSYGQWGNLFILVAVALAVLIGLRGRKREPADRSFFIAMILISVVFLFVTKMHERYMFPILLLSLFAFLQSLDRRLLHLFYGFTITNFVNMSYVLAFSKTTTDVPEDGIVLLGSIINIALFLYMLYVGHDRYVNGRLLALEPLQEGDKRRIDEQTLSGFKAEHPETEGDKGKHKLRRKDWIWMGSLTAVYAIVALVNLGSMKAPDTVWQPAQSGQSFYIDLGEVKTLDRVTSFGGVGTGKYKLEFAAEPGQWGNALEVDSNHVAVFAWSVHPAALDARYIKLTATQTGFSIHEMAVFEAGSKEPLPIEAVNNEEAGEPKRGAVSNLFDEQELAQYEHSFMKGSYFDEIYHARTAYEHIEGIVAYENTHPPLGKLIIAIGIKLFGLSPFGWRVSGAVLGILMVPIIYMTARRLFGRTAYAALAAGLLAVDFMHFTQTRISTIDVYGVFFIMLMFHFMNKYVSLSFYKTKLLATLLPLGLAGLFFGLGVASKWIVLYGGAGLAVMLGISLWDRYKEYAAAKRMLRRSDGLEPFDAAALARMTKVFPRYTIATLASCLLFYIVVPGAIYALSNIPVLRVMEGGYTFKALVDYQVHMYEYHSNLVSSHPFSSSWWEWPFMKRPVWYYSGDGLVGGLKSTIVAMGNPIIWWLGIFMMLATIWLSVKRRDKHVYMVWIAFLAQYVPWMLVPRETFLYHYFAMVPFLILSIVYVFKAIEEKYPQYVKIRIVFAAAAAAMFVLFYPALSGLTVPKWYVDVLLRWFPSWVF
ncbi:phospholipid carrier-dependent glycosyltransferase [Paenibacillus nanensis]|uniref:Polyprenol-phosphate-mannose--protein mannosyltransferase n=1 Tax=Paenibacillus nanensis TaxID=393251 RepID=A0A3A1UZ66_9BACL|nr:phospholipid carrier-dependent glycosyltransferase [Paenibacillus nanensis]RIX52462.1 phospholipid carrier-dependent glycosyltransferase [Paenibacillus nanensis]